MKYSEFKELADKLGTYEWRDVAEQMLCNDADITSGNYRLIHEDDIDQVQQEELESDLYILGHFNADFLSSILNIDADVILEMQKAEAFEAIGKLIISMGMIEELQQKYSGLDGYGHHFNYYDGNEEHIGSYYVFRTN